MNNKFSENLKKIRKEHNLSQEQLADMLGVSRQAVSKWESDAAYPEMDKIIMLCDKFNINIDDLLHKDIDEVNKSIESSKTVTKTFNGFLNYCSDSINLFLSMNLKTKFKCLFEQVLIMIILLVLSFIVVEFGSSFVYRVCAFLPNAGRTFINNLFDFCLVVLCFVVSITILTHVFKTRYLDYYKEYKDKKEEDRKIELTNEENIIIRDPKHSEYRFINILVKIIVFIVKLFCLGFVFVGCCMLVGLFTCVIVSFLINHTGILFVGTLISLLSSASICLLVIIVLFNFILNRASDKKKLLIGFLSSFIMLGIGCGMLLVGSLNFEIVDSDEMLLKIETKEYQMTNNLNFVWPYDTDINYVESDIDYVKVEYFMYEYCDLRESLNADGSTITLWSDCNHPIRIAKVLLDNLNNKKIISIESNNGGITVYASSKNIKQLKKTYEDYLAETESYSNRLKYYEKKIVDLGKQLDKCEEELLDED